MIGPRPPIDIPKTPRDTRPLDDTPADAPPEEMFTYADYKDLLKEYIKLHKSISYATREQVERERAKPISGCKTLDDLTKSINEKLKNGEINPGDGTPELLTTQAYTADALYNLMLQKSWLDTHDKIDTRRLQIALRAQRLSTQTVLALKKLQEQKLQKSTNEMKDLQ